MMSTFGSNLPAYLVQQFHKHQRYSGMGIAYNIAQAIFAGTAPFVQTKLVLSGHKPIVENNQSGSSSLLTPWLTNDSRIWPAYYIMAVATLGLFAITFGTPRIQRKLLASRYSNISDSHIQLTNTTNIGSDDNDNHQYTHSVDDEQKAVTVYTRTF